MGAVLVTLVTGALDTSPTARLIGAAIGAVIPVLVASGSAQGIMASALITGGALFITYGGFTFFDYARDKPATFPIPAAMPPPAENTSAISTTEDGLGLEVTPEAVTCDSDGCDEVTVTSTGNELLQIGTIEFVGEAASEFGHGGDCDGKPIHKDEQCSISVTFTPFGAGGKRSAILRIHQNLKGPATDVPVEGESTGPPPPTPTFDLAPELESCVYQEGGARVDGELKDALQISFTLRLLGSGGPSSLVDVEGTSNRGIDVTNPGGVGATRVVALPLEAVHYRRTHIVTVRVDPKNVVPETDETNNDFTVRVFVPPRPSTSTANLFPCSAS
jgi:hypothetical protein